MLSFEDGTSDFDRLIDMTFLLILTSGIFLVRADEYSGGGGGDDELDVVVVVVVVDFVFKLGINSEVIILN